MDSLTIIDCLLLIAKNDENAEKVFNEWLNKIKRASKDFATNAKGIIKAINDCYAKGNHTEEERDLAVFIAGIMYKEISLIRIKKS